jgi:hypothetical protein
MKNLSKFKYLLTASILSVCTVNHAQINRPAVGGWNTYLPYGGVIDFDSRDGQTFHCISKDAFWVLDDATGTIERYSKSNGMNDVGMSFVTYDYLTDQVVLFYQNGNIDVFKDGIFSNIPDVKISTVPGNKEVYHAYTNKGLLYMSTGLGLIVVDLQKKEIKETIPFYEGTSQGVVKNAGGSRDTIYAATDVGLFKTNVNNPQILNYGTWDKISNFSLHQVVQHHTGSNTYVASENTLYYISGGNLIPLRTTIGKIRKIDAAADDNVWLIVSQADTIDPYVVKITPQGDMLDSIPNLFADRFMDEDDGMYWSCEGFYGLKKKEKTAGNWQLFYPGGPAYSGAQKVWAKNGEVWLAHGAKDYNMWYPGLNVDAFSRYQNFEWKNWKWQQQAISDTLPYAITDAVTITKDEANKTVWVGYINGGLISVDENGNLKPYRAGYLGANIDGDINGYRVTSLQMDEENNLWLTQSQVNAPLTVKTNDNRWISYRIPGVAHLAALAIDDYGQKWMAVGNVMQGGLVVFNDNHTLDNTNDDIYKLFRMGDGKSNLQSNAVNTIAKDKSGTMWVGTENGIVLFSCGDIRTNADCGGTLKGIQSEGYNFASYLFEGIPVKSIAVDGGNRKWIGTSVGLFLMSDDDEAILEQFTAENSPLLSNAVISVDIDPVTGVVYVSTDKGLCSYGGAAVEAGYDHAEELFVYPNPVPSGYNGMISVRDVTEASNVKITDINGQLVFQGTSTGGQFSWNGKDYTGRKVQSGVYLIFVVSKDGTKKTNGKFIIHE